MFVGGGEQGVHLPRLVNYHGVAHIKNRRKREWGPTGVVTPSIPTSTPLPSDRRGVLNSTAIKR